MSLTIDKARTSAASSASRSKLPLRGLPNLTFDTTQARIVNNEVYGSQINYFIIEKKHF